jgi:hypothetical protein
MEAFPAHGDPKIEMAGGGFPSNKNTCSVVDSYLLRWTRSAIAVAVNSMVSSIYAIPEVERELHLSHGADVS